MSTSEPSYDWVTLEEDEKVIWEGKPHRYSLVPAFVIGIPLSVVLIGLVIIGWAWVDRENTSYVVTTEAVYKKRGALSRDVKRIAYEKIQNTSFKQGVLGTHFDYGTVEISTAGSEGAEMRFRAVTDPRGVQERLNRRLERTRDASEDEQPDTRDELEVLLEIRDEISAIRASLEGGQD